MKYITRDEQNTVLMNERLKFKTKNPSLSSQEFMKKWLIERNRILKKYKFTYE